MSVKLMGEVWELKLDHATSHVLLAMADHARDDGSRCFPSVGYLSWKTNYSLRQVQRILANLENTGIIIPVAYQNGGRGFATEYQLILAAAPRKESYQVAATKLSGKLRTATIARFGQVCQYCNKSGDAGKVRMVSLGKSIESFLASWAGCMSPQMSPCRVDRAIVKRVPLCPPRYRSRRHLLPEK